MSLPRSIPLNCGYDVPWINGIDIFLQTRLGLCPFRTVHSSFVNVLVHKPPSSLYPALSHSPVSISVQLPARRPWDNMMAILYGGGWARFTSLSLHLPSDVQGQPNDNHVKSCRNARSTFISSKLPLSVNTLLFETQPTAYRPALASELLLPAITCMSRAEHHDSQQSDVPTTSKRSAKLSPRRLQRLVQVHHLAAFPPGTDASSTKRVKRDMHHRFRETWDAVVETTSSRGLPKRRICLRHASALHAGAAGSLEGDIITMRYGTRCQCYHHFPFAHTS
jgi:hypothetical protein